MNRAKIVHLLVQMRAEQAEHLVATVRAAPEACRADLLARHMQDLDAATRARVYPLLCDAELDLLVPGMSAYLSRVSDAELRAIDHDEQAARRALRQIRR